MIIDSHQHFWTFDPVRDAWITEDMSVIRRDFLPEHLEPILQTNGVDGCVAVQADQSETETQFLLRLADENAFIKGVVGWLDLQSETIEKQLEHYASNQNLKGLRHIVQAEKNGFLLQTPFLKGISLLEKYNLTYDILVFHNQLPEVLAFVEKFPNQKFVLDHLGKPSIKTQEVDVWKKHINQLAQFPNVYCKVSGMVTEADMLHWKPNDFTPYLEGVFEAFGTKRVMYGSDWPVCLLGASYEEQLAVVKAYISKLSISEQSQFLGENAQEFYHLTN